MNGNTFVFYAGATPPPMKMSHGLDVSRTVTVFCLAQRFMLDPYSGEALKTTTVRCIVMKENKTEVHMEFTSRALPHWLNQYSTRLQIIKNEQNQLK